MAFNLIAVHRHFLRRERRFLPPRNFLDGYDDGELIQRFRFPAGMIRAMTDEFVAAGYGNVTRRSGAIPDEIKVCIAGDWHIFVARAERVFVFVCIGMKSCDPATWSVLGPPSAIQTATWHWT